MRSDERRSNDAPGPPRPPTLERFMEELTEIAPRSERPVSPDSHLVDDLGFDASTFDRLAFLLYRRYGVGGLSVASLEDNRHLTVEAFFRHCVLEVLGHRPKDR